MPRCSRKTGSSSLHRRLPLGGVWRWAKARAAAAPRSVMRSLRTRLLLYVAQLFALDPHKGAVVAVWAGLISGVVVTGLLMHARTRLLKTEALIVRQTPQPAHQPNATIQNRANNKKKDSKPAQDSVVIENWIEPGKTIQAQQPGPAVAAGHPIAITVTPLPNLATSDASTADPAQPAPSVPQVAEATENEATDTEVTGNNERNRRVEIVAIGIELIQQTRTIDTGRVVRTDYTHVPARRHHEEHAENL